MRNDLLRHLSVNLLNARNAMGDADSISVFLLSMYLPFFTNAVKEKTMPHAMSQALSILSEAPFPEDGGRIR